MTRSTPVPPADVVAALRAAGCVFAEDEARLLTDAAGGPDELAALVAQRVRGTPLEQVLGWADFCGLRVAVRPGVFVPRRRTGILVAHAVRLLGPGSVVVDLCCGSGAVGAALTRTVPGVELYATDIDPGAVACAWENLPDATVLRGDLYDALPGRLRGRVDLIVVNAPYVPTDEIELMPPEARDHEPRVALDGGPDGVAVHRRIAGGARDWLAPGGHLLVETSERQASVTAEAFSQHRLDPRVVRSEGLGGTAVLGSPRE